MSIFQNINGSLLPIAGFQKADEIPDITSEHPIQNSTFTNTVNALNDYGCKNLCVYPYMNTTGVTSGITWTDIGDGTVTASGKISSGQTYSSFTGSYTTINTAGTYIFTGCPSGGSDSTYYINVSVDGTSVGHDTGNGLQLTLTAGQVVSFGIAILDTVTTFSNLTFKPMIRDARISDDSFVPYAMSNRQLTTRLNDYVILVQDTVNLGSVSSGSASYVSKQVTIPSGYRAVMVTADIAQVGIVNGGIMLYASVNTFPEQANHGMVYVGYRAFSAYDSTRTTVELNVLCVKI